MAATITIEEWTSTGTRTDKTSGVVRFKNANDSDVDLNSPLVVPTTVGGTDYSFNKMLRLEIGSNAASFTQLSNLQFYTDGTNTFGAGVNLLANASTWDPPSAGTTNSTGADAFSYESTAPLVLSTTTYGSSAYSSTVGAIAEIGSFADLLMFVTTDAGQGTLAAETVTFSYDEI
jgi:hypothetical protein